MKKLLALILAFSLVFPALAWATESEEPLPPPEETTNPAPNATPETTSYAIHIFDYVIVVVPGTTETPTTVGLFTADTSGTPTDAISSYTVGGILGQAVSVVAQTVSPGPEHGKVVSAFVHQAVQARKEAHKQEMTEKKEETKQKIEEKRDQKSGKEKPLKGEDKVKGKDKEKGGKGGNESSEEDDD